MKPRHLDARRHEGGFVIVAVLVISGLIATLAATYAHHVIASERSSLATPSLIEAREAAHSSAEYARQALLTGQSVTSSWSSPDGTTTSLAVASLSDTEREIVVSATRPDGTGATKVIDASLTPDPTSTPSGPDDLPHLPQATVDSLMADSSIPKTWYSSDTIVSDSDLVGLHIIKSGVNLQLSNVALKGAIVSEETVDEGTFGSFDASGAPNLIIDGGLRIDSDATVLPGVAILMPDGTITSGWTSGTVQIEGDVVAHDISIPRSGALDGNLKSVTTPYLDPGLDLIGTERKPKPWSTDFDWGDTWDASSLAVVPSYVTIAELSAIIDYWQG